jgi:hypothetical protein
MALPTITRTIESLTSLVAFEDQPRKISRAAAKRLKASIERWGLVQEIVVNRRNNRIVGGNQRVKALLLAGETTAPVAWVDLGEDEEMSLSLALNSPELAGEYDQARIRQAVAKAASAEDFALAELIKQTDILPPPIDPYESDDNAPLVVESVAVPIVTTREVASLFDTWRKAEGLGLSQAFERLVREAAC